MSVVGDFWTGFVKHFVRWYFGEPGYGAQLLLSGSLGNYLAFRFFCHPGSKLRCNQTDNRPKFVRVTASWVFCKKRVFHFGRWSWSYSLALSADECKSVSITFTLGNVMHDISVLCCGSENKLLEHDISALKVPFYILRRLESSFKIIDLVLAMKRKLQTWYASDKTGREQAIVCEGAGLFFKRICSL